jgi:hypothetical protein
MGLEGILVQGKRTGGANTSRNEMQAAAKRCRRLPVLLGKNEFTDFTVQLCSYFAATPNRIS